VEQRAPRLKGDRGTALPVAYEVSWRAWTGSVLCAWPHRSARFAPCFG